MLTLLCFTPSQLFGQSCDEAKQWYKAFNVDEIEEWDKNSLKYFDTNYLRFSECFSGNTKVQKELAYADIRLKLKDSEQGKDGTTLRLIEQLQKEKDISQDLRVRLLRMQGKAYLVRGEPYPAIKAYTEAAVSVKLVASPVEQANIFLSLAIAHKRVHQLETSKIWLQQARQFLSSCSSVACERTLTLILISEGDTKVTELDLKQERQYEGYESLRAQLKARIPYHTNQRNPEMLAGIWNLLGVLYAFDKNPNLPEAIAAFQEVRRIGKKTRHYARATYRLGQLYIYDKKQTEKAYTLFQEALQTGAEKDRVFSELGSLYEQQGDLEEAEKNYKRAIAEKRGRMDSIQWVRWAMSSFTRDQMAYRGLVRVLVKQNKYEEAFEVFEQSKGRYLNELRRQVIAQNRLTSGDQQVLAGLNNELQEIYYQLLQPLSQEERLRLFLKEAVAQVKLNDFWKGKNEETIQVFKIKPLLQYLKENQQTLVSYFLDQEPFQLDKRALSSFVFVVTGEGVQVVPLSIHEKEMGKLSVQAKIQDGGRVDFSKLHTLYQNLFVPIKPFLSAKTKRLIVLPEGGMLELPLGALLKKETVIPHPNDFLIADYAFAYEVNATSLITKKMYEDNDAFLAFGKSTFDGYQNLKMKPLTKVHEELNGLVEVLPKVEVFEDEQATKERFLQEIERAKVLHIATHAKANVQHPFYSSIILSPEQFERGVLYLFELYHKRLNIELVVLSACETAKGEVMWGEGMEGMHYVLRASGVRSVVSSLWNLSDKSASQILKTFYRQLRDGVPRDVALQQAQLAYLNAQNKPELAAPFFWASLVLYGENTALPQTPVETWHQVLAFLALFAFGYLFYRTMK